MGGKRGMERFVCASLARTPVYSDAVSAWIHQPCIERPKQGGIFCQAHDDEEDNPLEDTVAETHRRADGGQLQFRVSFTDAAGQERTSWVSQDEVPPTFSSHLQFGFSS